MALGGNDKYAQLTQSGESAVALEEGLTESVVDRTPLLSKVEPEKPNTGDDDESLDTYDPWFLWKLAFELIVFTMLLYYVDFAFDISALISFYNEKQYWFLSINGIAILATAALSFVELLSMGKDFSMSSVDNLLLGISFPFHLHIACLTALSVKYKAVHPLLVATKFAEAGIEAVISSGIQLYSILFCNEALEFATCNFTPYDRSVMMLSVLSSCASISVAFTMFDLRDYGASGFPGSILSKLNWKYCLVLAFRFAEVGSRLLSCALFQFATRPNGIFILTFVDAICVLLMIHKCGGYMKYVVPCMCCLVNPLLEKNNVLSIDHAMYYAYRVFQVVVIVVVAILHNPTNTHLALTVFPLKQMSVLCLALTISWMLLLPIIRSLAEPSMEKEDYPWGSKPFTDVQGEVRARMLHNNVDLANGWLDLYFHRLKRFLIDLQKITDQREDEDAADECEMQTTELLHYEFNMPLCSGCSSDTVERIAKISQDLASKLYEEFGGILSCKPHDLSSVFFLAFGAALRRNHTAVLNMLVLNKVGPRTFANYVSAVLQRYSESDPEEYHPIVAGESDASSTDEVSVPCSEGHRLNDVATMLGNEAIGQIPCDECGSRANKMWGCLPCREMQCDECYRKKQQVKIEELNEERRLARVDGDIASGRQPEDELNQLLVLINTIMKTLGKAGAMQLIGGEDGCPVKSTINYLQSVSIYNSEDLVDEEKLRAGAATRAGLEILLPLVRRQFSKPLNEIRSRDILEFFEGLIDFDAKFHNVSIVNALPWFPPSVEVPQNKAKVQALEMLTKFYMRATETKGTYDDIIVIRLLVDYVVSLSSKKSLSPALHSALQKTCAQAKKGQQQRQNTKEQQHILEDEAAILESLLEETSNAQISRATIYQELRSINTDANEAKLVAQINAKSACCRAASESKDVRALKQAAWTKAKPKIEKILPRVGKLLTKPKQSGISIALGAQIVHMLLTWFQVEQCMEEISEKDGEHIMELLKLLTAFALESDAFGCEAVLSRVLALLKFIFSNPVKVFGDEEKRKLLDIMRETISPKLRPEEERRSVRELFMIYTAGTVDVENATTYIPKLIKEEDWHSLYILVPQLDWNEASDNAQQLAELLLRAVIEKHDFKPSAEAMPLIERAMGVLTKAPKGALTPNNKQVVALAEIVREYATSLLAQSNQIMKKIAPFGLILKDMESLRFTLFQDWPGHPEGAQKKGSTVTMSDLLKLGKAIACIFYTSW